MTRRHVAIQTAGWLAAVTAVGAAAGVVIRHDVPDAEYLQAATAPEFSNVGLMVHGGFYASGSGTLVRDNWVLTAAHVADDAPETDWAFLLDGTTYRVADVFVHPQWTGDLNDNHDVALMRLDTRVASVTPALLFRGNDSPDTPVMIIGYGGAGTGLTGSTTFDLERRAATNRVDGYVLDYVLFDFDPPGTGQVTIREGMAAPVDSGGPVMIETGEGWQVSAVHSFIEDAGGDGLLSSYADLHGAARVAPYLTWMDGILPAPCSADVNRDDSIDVADLLDVLAAWGGCGAPCPPACPGDTNTDCAIDVTDLLDVLAAWGEC